MNFLSHFYFDRHSTDSNLILGTVLPDLIKNANKTWTLHPQKHVQLFSHDEKLLSILEGWKRHLLVDRYFHASDFFCEHTAVIRAAIAPLLTDSPVRPSFLSHIALELMLDSLLITENIIDAGDFYKHLQQADHEVLTEFLELNNITNKAVFFQFFNRFIESAYLNQYRDPDHILYALNRICMRIWDDPMNKMQQESLRIVLLSYQAILKNSFMNIFKNIDTSLI